MIKSILITTLLILTGCNNSEPKKSYNAKKLINEKCASCHNLNMPPIISDNELAPPMMAISFHIHNFMKPTNESERTSIAISFVTDYVRNPSLEKSYCDKESIKRYGLMPSQKESVTQGETEAIAKYMFKHYTQENLSIKQKEQAKYDALEDGEKIALKYRCLGCHKIDKKIIGPSFINIAKRYKNSDNNITYSILNGSKEEWKSSNGAVMPIFKNITKNELKVLKEWILNRKKQ